MKMTEDASVPEPVEHWKIFYQKMKEKQQNC
jgi:hypothetical protein